MSAPKVAAPFRVVFMGTPEFAVPVLKALIGRPDLARIVGVYTQPDRPAGRGQLIAKSAVKVVAEELNLPLFQPENVNEPEEKRRLADLMSDLAVVAAYAQFLGKGVLNTPRLGCFNVHSSLLPKYRGAAPIQYAIWKGERETGVTIMKMSSKLDAGAILLQEASPIGPQMTARDLHDELSRLGARLIVEALSRMQREGHLKEVHQEEDQATYAPALTKEQGLIDWNKSGEEVLRQIRAFDPWPGTYGRSTRGILKVHKAKCHASLSGAPSGAAPGAVFTGAGGFFVKVGDGWLELLTVQPEGKKMMSAQEFLNGIRNVSELTLT